ncbi:MAG: SDR family oxidoreductase [Cyanobacteria bacterium Co-bin8]|nr:SDR family oxidoreductase [Cyanobacteria bacterium Co-bin8]
MSQTFLITGASSGIGYELAKVCGRDGHNLVLVARREEPLKALKAELESAHGIQVWTYRADLAQADVRQQLFDWTQTEGIPVDGLVNNAGFGDYGPFVETDWAKQEQMILLNVLALTHLTRLFLPAMVARRQGKILNLASTAAFQPGPLMAVYFATKAYVLSFTSAIASELEGTGVTATTFCPGPTTSEFQENSGMGQSKLVQGRKLPTAAEVAELGYQAMQRGEWVAVQGLSNRALTLASRFLPRRLLTNAVRQMQSPA